MEGDSGIEGARVSFNYVSSLQEPSFCVESSHRPSEVAVNHDISNIAEQDLTAKPNVMDKLSVNTSMQATQGFSEEGGHHNQKKKSHMLKNIEEDEYLKSQGIGTHTLN